MGFDEELIHLLCESILEPEGWPAGEGAGVLNFELQRKEVVAPERILIIQLTSIGDVVMATPVIEGLREKYPQAHIAFLVDEPSLDVVRDNPFLNETILFEEYRYFREIKTGKKIITQVESELADFITTLRYKAFDLLINLHLSKRAAILSKLIEAKETIGLLINEDKDLFVRGNLWIYYLYLRMFIHQRREVPGRFIHQAELYLRLAGLTPGRYKTCIEITEEGKREGHNLLASNGVRDDELLVGLNPGANWPSKRWPVQKFAELGDALHREYGAKIIVFGGPEDVKLGERISEIMEIKPIDATGRLSLKGLAYVLSRCRLLITNDTGPMHIAGAVGTPVVSICGPVFGGPYGRGGHIVLYRDIDCIECGKTKCEDHRCMEEIEIRDVITAVKISLNGDSQGERIKRRGIRLYFSGIGENPGVPFFYIPDDSTIEELCERILNLSYLKYWEYLNCQLTGIGKEVIQAWESKGWDCIREKREVALRIKEEMDKFIRLEDLCAYGEKLSQRLHSLMKFGVRSLESQEEGRKIDELLARLYLIDKEIEETGSAGRFLKFLGLFERDSLLQEDKRVKIARDSFQAYHTKKEACLYLQGILREILEGLKEEWDESLRG